MTTQDPTPEVQPQGTIESTTVTTAEDDKGPHAHIRQVESENKTLRERLLKQEIKDLGLDPDKELGKAIVKTYQGSFEEGDVARFATDEYGFESTTPAPTAVTQAAVTEQTVENLNAHSEPVTPAVELPPLQAAQQVMNDPEASKEDIVAGLGVVAMNLGNPQ